MDTENRALSQKFFFQAFWVLVFLLTARLIANYWIPLNDTTEARYGEIARKMLETGNWVNLLHDYGIPFWAKPPLSTWLSAFSMKLFGVNEFAVRLPGLFLSLGVLWLVGDLVKEYKGSIAAMISVLILSGTLFFFLDAGVVMTDPSLVFCTTLSMVAFWRALVHEQKLWSYLFFIGLGLGMLAKGPIAVVLVALPVFCWVLFRNQWFFLWKRLPWFKGILLFFMIALPWYIWAELRSPGFLNYFIVGEHFSRFLISGWAGDKYGIAHHAATGMIWLYAIVGIFPWNIVAAKWLIFNGNKRAVLYQDKDGWLLYLGLWMLAPLFFFTFASNIIYPYVFPSLPPFALFFMEIWLRSKQPLKNSSWVVYGALMCGCLFLVVTLLFVVKPDLVAKTQKPVIEAWIGQHPPLGSTLIYWADKIAFSAQFYAFGHVTSVQNQEALAKLLSSNRANYLVINSKQLEQLSPSLLTQFTVVKRINNEDKAMLLLRYPAQNG